MVKEPKISEKELAKFIAAYRKSIGVEEQDDESE